MKISVLDFLKHGQAPGCLLLLVEYLDLADQYTKLYLQYCSQKNSLEGSKEELLTLQPFVRLHWKDP